VKGQGHFFHEWTKGHQIAFMEKLQLIMPFPLVDCLIRSRDICNRGLELSEI